MAMTLQDYRNYVREYLDLETEDVSDFLIGTWVQEGLNKIAYFVRRWPFYETTHEFVVDTSTDTYVVPLRSIYAIEGSPKGALNRLDPSAAGDYFFYGNGAERPASAPQSWTQWGGQSIRLWPSPDAVYTLRARGWRDPLPIGAEAGALPDIPEHLHHILLNWVMHRAYLHQGDDDYAQLEARTFEESLSLATNNETQSDVTPLMVMGGGARNPHRGQQSGMRDPFGPGLGGWGF